MNKHEALQADLATLKAHLKMAFVMEHYGHTAAVHDTTTGKLHYHSPFRQGDDSPSFDIFPYLIKGRTAPEERYGDYADPDLHQGDVVDLVAKFEACSSAMAQAVARELLAEQIESGWDGPTVEHSVYHVLDMAQVQEYITLRRPLSASATWAGLPRTHPGLTGLVPPSDRVFLHPQYDIIVFLLCDEVGEVRGVRHRDSEGKKYGLQGGQNILMRLEPPSDKPVILTEGETDLWAAWGALHEDYEVLGVPGVGTTPEAAGANTLAGRVVYVVFDPDAAGAKGRSVWAEYLVGIGCDVRTIILPDGRDVAQLDPEQIKRLPDRARSVPPAPPNFLRMGTAYGTMVQKGKGDNAIEEFVERSNWSFIPQTILIGADGSRTYNGKLLPSGRAVKLPDTALVSGAQLKAWGRRYQAHWYGSDPQVQQLAALLAHESAYLPEGRVTSQVGLYEGTFVWPEGCIGQVPVEYVPGVTEVRYGPDVIFLEDKPVNPVAVFQALFHSQHPAVTGPVLAWLAAAPLRTRFHQFPVLNITGVSGSGKSELTSEFLRAFSSSQIATTLTSSTPHAVSGQIANSTGFPVWFDEYRPGGGKEAMDRLDQTIRDAYTMQLSKKGGQNRANLSEVVEIPTAAPIIVTGEDNFNETSLTDRMVLVRLRRQEQGDLAALRRIDVAGFGHAYLRFLTQPSQVDLDSPAPVFTRMARGSAVEDGLRPRQSANMAVLRAGWAYLDEFLSLHDPTFVMPDLDLTRVVAAGEEAGASDPTTELLKSCLENDTRLHTVWRMDGYLAVSVANLIEEAQNHRTITLPVSNAPGLRKTIADQYGIDGEPERTWTVPRPGESPRRIRAIRIPDHMLPWLSSPEENDADYPEI